MTRTASTRKRKLDVTSFVGLLLGLVGIGGGLLLDGGRLQEIMQPTAMLIVLGGTLGATLVTTPRRVMGNALRNISIVFFEPVLEPNRVIEEIVDYATRVRKHGLISLERDVERIEDPFFRKAMTMAIDGVNAKQLKQTLDLELELERQSYEEIAHVYIAAGGYAPTIGIVGAVLGLMQVMKNLANISEVGHGIATAFVATVYGVASANIFFLPAGGKIQGRFEELRQMRQLCLVGVLSIIEGLNPRIIQSKLEAYAHHLQPDGPRTEDPFLETSGGTAGATEVEDATETVTAE